jgi:hypothetical protein
MTTVNFGNQTIQVRVGDLAAAQRAEAAANAAEALVGPSFPDTTAGIAGTNDGDFFAVTVGGITTIYLNSGGTAVEQRTLNRFIQSGAGAVARNQQDKSRETVSVFDFMAPALAGRISARTSGSSDAADTTAAILDAIAAANQRTIFLPPGVYNVNEIHIQAPNTYIRGAGPSATQIIQRTANVDTFRFGPPTSGPFLNGARIEGMNITHSSVVDASTTGAAVRFVQCNAYRLRDMSLNDSPEGLSVEGGQLGSLKTFNVFAFTGSAKGGGSALLHFREADLGGGNFQPQYTTQVEDFRLSASKLRDTCLRIASADGLTFSNGYIAFGENSLCKVAFDRDGAYVAGCSFANTYFDCVNISTGTPDAIVIPDDAFTGSTVFDFKIGSGCIVGNGSGWGLLCTKPEVMVLSAQDARFVNFKTAAFVVENASGDLLDAQIDGCHFQNCGSVSTSVVRLANGRSLSVSNNTFADNLNVQVTIAGNWRTGSVTGNVNAQTAVADLDRSSATFASPLVIAGNSSRRTVAANSWIGNRVGNFNSDDPLALDWYQEGTFTPTITFGGAAAGVTYSNQTGNFTRIGNRIFYNLNITLSSKGSSTGEFRIAGLPTLSSDANVSYPASLRMTNMANDLGATHCVADVIGSDSAVRILKTDNTGATEIMIAATDADFTNTSRIVISGSYRCA